MTAEEILISQNNHVSINFIHSDVQKDMKYHIT
jgi:hypothetical protein